MAKKFDKISPKNISEEKFDKVKVKKSKKKKLTKKENQKISKIETREDVRNLGGDPKIEETEITSEVFVYECGGILFGIPVAYVTEITNDYGTISPLKGFLRSCIGTTEYRGKLLPIFQSQESYLKIDEIKKDKNNNLDKIPSAIITINYKGIMFALTMETHVGIVSIKSKRNYKNAEAFEDENRSDLLKDIVWYGEQNLFIFSPEKISMLVFSELKNQIAVGTEEDIDSKSSEEEITDLGHDYMVAKIKNSTIAIEITKVLEVIEGSDVTPLYKVADFIRGLISLRGQVLSCIDLSKYLGHELTVIDERNKFIVISVSGVDFALCIDRVLGIQSIQQSSFQDSTKVFQNDIPDYFPNFREKEGEVTLIFKPDSFLKSAELQEYKKN